MFPMASEQNAIEILAMQREKRRVASNSVLAAMGITAFKAVVGYSTGSLGILSEAAHSGLDLIAAIITMASVRVSDRPADADHQYGHGKFENFSAFIETALLLATCVWIVVEAVRRLFYHDVHIQPTVWAFLVMAASIVVDLWRSRRLQRIAAKYDSQALEADALHFSTDVWSSAVVILGLALVAVAQKTHIEALYKADAISALIVAGVIVMVSSRLARQTIDALTDAAPAGVRGQITENVRRVDGVLEVDRVRIRRAGNRYFADVSIGLTRNTTFHHSDQIAADVVRNVRTVLPEADVVVHTAPRAPADETIFDRIRDVALRNNYNVHDVSVQEILGKIHVEQHLELEEHLTLKQAHDMVTLLEAQVRGVVPEIATILTHIESEPNTIETGDKIVHDAALEAKLRALSPEFPEILDIHEVIIKHVRGLLYLSCHCTMPDDMPLTRVHDVSTALEIRLKQVAPQLFKVLIHTEPQTDNRR